MQTSRLSYYFLLFLCLWGCGQENKPQNESKRQTKKAGKDALETIDTVVTSRSMNYRSSSDIASYKAKILAKGDTVAYWQLKIAMLDFPPENLVFWAKCMADVYDYPQAYLDYVMAVTQTYKNRGIDLKDINVQTKSELKQYLKKAKSKGIRDTLINF